MKLIVLSLVAVMGMASSAYAKKQCEGIFPKNHLWLGVNFVDQGITEADFNKVLDQVVAVYNPIVANHGFQLQFNRLWSDGTVNSDTDTEGDRWVINSYGGLARYDGMTMDGYAAVACHELGHHLGGAPLFDDGSEMSVEGEADYHVGTKCLRNLWVNEDNVKALNGKQIDPTVSAQCTAQYSGNTQSIAMCERIADASFVVAKILQELEGDSPIGFNTPDPTVVRQTDEEHPAAQCRLDTYFQSGLCTVSQNIELSNDDYKVGSCVDGTGSRPLCWFAPN